MALTVINGLRDVGSLGSEYYTKETKDFFMTLKAGNTVVDRGGIPFLTWLKSKTKTVERVPGQAIPVERFNVYFTTGGYTTNGYGFEKYTDKFEVPTETGLTAITYNWSEEDILKARERGIDLIKKMTEQLQAYTNVYENMVLPYRIIQTLLTGSSLATKIVTEGTDSENYTRAFGWLRGEDASDFLKPHLIGADGKRCHYRGTKGASFAMSDVRDCVDLLKSYKDASPLKPYALANNRTIQDCIGSVLEYAGNKDEYLVQGLDLKYREALGCKWVDMDTYLPDGVIIFLDAQAMDLIIEAISPDPEQRGIAFVKTVGGNMTPFANAEDLAGGVVKVFPVELMIAKRHLGVILDTKKQGETSSGKEGWAKDETIKKLETFAKNLRDSYMIEMK